MDTKVSFLTPNFVDHEVAGTSRRFYALSVKTIFKLKDVIRPIAAALTTLFAGHNDKDNAEKQETIKSKDGEIARVEISAIDVKLAALRAERREKAITDLIAAFSDDKNQRVLAELLMSSMREDFPAVTPQAVEDFLADPNLTAPVVIDLFRGLAKANAGAFGPLLERAVEKVPTTAEPATSPTT